MTIHYRFLLVSATALGMACAPEAEPFDPVDETGGTGATGGSGGTFAGVGGASGGSAGKGTGGTGGALGGSGGVGGSGGTVAGSGGTAGVATGGAGASTGGTAGSPSGGAGTGGSAGSGGASGQASGGTSGSGDQGGASGAAGAAAGSGGAAGGSAAGGTGGGSAAVPSAGCGKSGRPANGVVTVTNDHIYTFPTTYDGTKPFPLFIGMHAAGNPIDQFRNLTNGSAIETNMVRAFPKSAGNEWNYNNDLAKVTGMYDDLMANYCIDKSRVFSSGHSSGAQMIVQILNHQDAATHMNYKAVAPVAASNYGAIALPIPVMYIQGKNDSVRNSDGADVVARFRTANSCMMTSMPYDVAMCMSGGTSVTPGCISYDGCSKPTIWCSHNDPQYSNTSHGVPCFAVKAMYDFFTGLP